MTRVIVVANQKGGVGKTTTVANLGVALASYGKRVMLVDLDSQAALTATFGLNPYELERTTYSILIHEKMALARTLHPVGDGKMAIAPASIDLATAEVQLANAPGRARRLRDALERNRIPFDYIVVDTPPSLGLLTLNGLVAGTDVLIPVQCQYLAMRGVRSLMEVVWRVKRRLNPDLKLLGLIPTMYMPDSQHAEEVMKELRDVFRNKVFDIVIENSPAFAEAPAAHQTVVEYAPKHKGAIAYRKLAEVIISYGLS